jgi:hypothetical protein
MYSITQDLLVILLVPDRTSQSIIPIIEHFVIIYFLYLKIYKIYFFYDIQIKLNF